ncbi:MAG: RidA family protein [Anaerofustis stercorihominis]|nr:RidA family protein [Anaerofustis stercorihominis]
MTIKAINTEKAPAAIGPYSQGIIAGNMLFLSGQGGIDPATGKVVEGGIEAEALQTMKNIKALLEEAGIDFTKVVKTTCFLADMNDFAAFNAIYAEYFTTKPARSCVAAKDLPLGFKVEVEVVAYLG